ncbi:DUF4276 family protein [Rhodovulum steppense]|uniref:Uncharacterized protein DUF4276 n=1 Tax=Rhodovulum steppense TaxID=540251 RepID=A0A4V2R3M9_9RHOB|nr:DUF4276 family protein [Rhodovulum steppense]TCM77799.1 uncharacterized protein DUF4276 [Rhodovulum steppense]
MLVILTEEESMEITLRDILPRLGVVEFQIITFQGVGDLEASLTAKIKAWRDPSARFLVIRDNDNGDCGTRKQRLLKKIAAAGGARPAKIRLVMQELEAWFLADPEALENAGYLKPGSRPALLRDPESHARPVDALRKLDPAYQKGLGARRIAPHLNPDRNTAASFHATIQAIRDLTAA